MDPINFIRDLSEESPSLGLALVNQMKNWPTTHQNLRTNCEIFQQLQPKESEFVKGLSDEYYELLCMNAYVNQALIQRGLMNIQYYILLDEAMNYGRLDQDGGRSKKSKNQKGGMKLKQLFAGLASAFLLLGSSEGITAPETTLCDPRYGECKQESVSSLVAPGESSLVFKPPVAAASSEKELQELRIKAAEKTLTEMTEQASWVLPEQSIVIFQDANEQQLAFLEGTMNDLNAKLASLSRDAETMCGDLASTASNLGVFSNDEFVEKVVSLANELTEKAETKTVSATVADTAVWFSSGITQSASSTATALWSGQATPEVKADSAAVMREAYDKVVEEVNLGRVGQVESYASAFKYQQLCRATPSPRFKISTDGNNNVLIQTRFGNNNTGKLLLCHMETIERIKLKLSTSDSLSEQEKDALKSLKERTEMEIKLIESSALFAPLDGVIPGLSAVQGVIGDATMATSKFERIVERMAEALPITKENAEVEAAIRKQMFDMKTEARKQIADEWRVVISESTKAGATVLTDVVQNTAEATFVVVTSASELVQNATSEVGNVLTTGVGAVGKVADAGLYEVGNVAGKSIDILSQSVYRLVIPAVFVLGIMGAGAWIMIKFRNGMLGVGRQQGGPSERALELQIELLRLQQQQQQQQQQQPQQRQIEAAPAPAGGLDLLAQAAAMRAAPAGGTLKRKHRKRIARKTKKNKAKKTKIRKNKKAKKSHTKKLRKRK